MENSFVIIFSVFLYFFFLCKLRFFYINSILYIYFVLFTLSVHLIQMKKWLDFSFVEQNRISKRHEQQQ